MNVRLTLGPRQVTIAIAGLVGLALAGTALQRRSAADRGFSAVVRRGNISAQLTTTGTLKPTSR